MIKKYIKKCEMYSMIISILMIVLSLCLIFKPVKSIETFVLLFSIIMLVNGVIGVVTYFTIESDERLFSFDLLSGITNILAGVLVFMYRSSLVEVFAIMLGIYVIVSNLLKMQISINLSTVPESNWVLLVIMSILNMIIGVLLITNPFESIITIASNKKINKIDLVDLWKIRFARSFFHLKTIKKTIVNILIAFFML